VCVFVWNTRIHFLVSRIPTVGSSCNYYCIAQQHISVVEWYTSQPEYPYTISKHGCKYAHQHIMAMDSRHGIGTAGFLAGIPAPYDDPLIAGEGGQQGGSVFLRSEMSGPDTPWKLNALTTRDIILPEEERPGFGAIGSAPTQHCQAVDPGIMSAPFSRDMIARIIDTKGADNLTAKKVRILLEDQLGLKAGALKAYKDDISQQIDEVLAGKVQYTLAKRTIFVPSKCR
jgi:hypothetical protein